jgi:uncharacterized protein YcbK (DUF882 family)
MRSRAKRTPKKKRGLASRFALLGVIAFLFVARDAPAHTIAPPVMTARLPAEAAFTAGARDGRVASWTAALRPIEVTGPNTGAGERIALYDRNGNVDDGARAAFERVAARELDPHRLAERVEQLVFKAAYHFGAARLVVVSGWREHAGKHTSGDAIDFKLPGVHASVIAAYLRGLPRVGVGVYTHPATQFVHVDARDSSYHWVDASPPGVHWKERPIGDRWSSRRDAAYTPQSDLPLERR